MVVVAARGDEGRAVPHPLHDLEAEQPAIEGEGPLDVGDLEMDVPDLRLGRRHVGVLGPGLRLPPAHLVAVANT